MSFSNELISLLWFQYKQTKQITLNQKSQNKKAQDLSPTPILHLLLEVRHCSSAVCMCGFIHIRIFSECPIIFFRRFSLTATFLLSSRTVFMLSIHRVSMGPSKITHLRSGVSASANSLKVVATTPSVHCPWEWDRNRVNLTASHRNPALGSPWAPTFYWSPLVLQRAASNFGVSPRVLNQQQIKKK